MRWLTRWGRHVDDRHREIEDEIDAHIAACVDHLVRQGIPRDRATREAVRRFGNFEAGRTALHAQAALPPTARIGFAEALAGAWDDARYVCRALARQPAFTAGVALTMALGLGINVAVFRVADYVLLRAPARVADPASVRTIESLVTIGKSAPQRASQFSYVDASRVLGARGLGPAAAFANTTLRDSDGRDVAVTYTDGAFFRTLGVAAALGRVFDADEGRPGGGIAVSVISDRLWHDRFGGAALGALPRLRLGPIASTIIGVMPRGFAGLDADPVDVWLPFGIAEIGRTEINGVVIPWYRSTMLRAMRLVTRLPSGPVEPVVRSALSAAMTSSDDPLDGVSRQADLRPIVPVGSRLQNHDLDALIARLGLVAGVILVIACANAINLLLARGVRRQREIAIRLALGAGRSRIARLVVGESLALALLGAAVAVLAGQWTAEALRRLLFPDARWTAGMVDPRTLVFIGVLTVATGLVSGVLPALQSVSPDLVSALKRRVGSPGRTRLTRSGFVVVQTGLSLALLVASGLLVRSMIRLNAVPLGFDPAGLIMVSTGRALHGPPPPGGLEAADAAAKIGAGITDASGIAVATVVPFGNTTTSTLRVIGSSYVPDSPLEAPNIAGVSANYFTVMRTRIREGRGFTDRDGAGTEPVALISASMAQRYFTDAVPPGACLMAAGLACARIVGVVDDVLDTPGGVRPPMKYYLPLAQINQTAGGLVVRAAPDRARAAAGLIRSLFPPTQRGVVVEVVADRVARALRPWTTATMLFAALGALALAIASAGVYSVMSYMTSERTHEIGVRMVLGAAPADVWRLVLGSGLRLTIAGSVAGALAAALVGRSLQSLLFGVSPFDPLVYVLGAIALLAAMLVAVLPPALRASHVDPVNAVRAE